MAVQSVHQRRTVHCGGFGPELVPRCCGHRDQDAAPSRTAPWSSWSSSCPAFRPLAMASLPELPPELLCTVLVNLDEPRAILNVTQACKSLNDDDLWLRVLSLVWGTERANALAKCLTANCYARLLYVPTPIVAHKRSSGSEFCPAGHLALCLLWPDE